MSDNRQSRRQRVYKTVRLTFNYGMDARNCLLRNVSDHGALIEFDTGTVVPDRFRLYDEIAGYRVDCEVIWRRNNSAGIKFLAPRESIRPVRKQSITIPQSAPRSSMTGNGDAADTGTRAYSIYPARFGKRRNSFA